MQAAVRDEFHPYLYTHLFKTLLFRSSAVLKARLRAWTDDDFLFALAEQCAENMSWPSLSLRWPPRTLSLRSNSVRSWLQGYMFYTYSFIPPVLAWGWFCIVNTKREYFHHSYRKYSHNTVLPGRIRELLVHCCLDQCVCVIVTSS